MVNEGTNSLPDFKSPKTGHRVPPADFRALGTKDWENGDGQLIANGEGSRKRALPLRSLGLRSCRGVPAACLKSNVPCKQKRSRRLTRLPYNLTSRSGGEMNRQPGACKASRLKQTPSPSPDFRRRKSQPLRSSDAKSRAPCRTRTICRGRIALR